MTLNNLYSIQNADFVCSQSLARPRHGWRLTADNFPLGRRIAKLMLASSAWWGFAGASDRQRLAAFIRRSDRSRFVPANLPTFADLCHDADEKMFAAITSDRNHVLHHLLSPQSTGSQNYNLRQRTHNLALPSRTGHLTDHNFIQRMLYFDVGPMLMLVFYFILIN